MGRSSSYSMKNVVSTVDGQEVRGLFDGDDVIQIEQGADIGTLVVGAGGDSIFSQSSDDSANITLKLMHTSPTHTLLSQKLNMQKSGTIVPFPVTVTDISSGEGGIGAECYIMKAPTDTKGKSATVREWVLACGQWFSSIPNL